MSRLTLLGLESSCDDSAAAILTGGPGGPGTILAAQVAGQEALHARYGGVVPEIAARAHVEVLDRMAEAVLNEAGLTLADLDGIAVTAGPGLIGGLIAGVMLTKGLAAGSGLPMIGVNHLAGHALTPRLTDGLAYPYLALLASGGHCQFVIVRAPDRFHRLGGTIDDAPGEAFDKAARLLGLPQPGGPAIERTAAGGDPDRHAFPRPLLDRPGADLSFSGLKTALARAVVAAGTLDDTSRADLAASFQAAIVDTLAEKSRRALAAYLAGAPDRPAFAVAGGVAANGPLRARLTSLCDGLGVAFHAPPPWLCTDNAAIIAWAGIELFAGGRRDGPDLAPRARWPLDAIQAPMLGFGRRGAKA